MPGITKAVFPVAGLGTRFLPATKASPKEMLPIVDKPLIQLVAEEAVAAGITELIFVVSRARQAIIDHFDRAWELEHELERRNAKDKLRIVRNILPEGVSCIFVRQPEPLGLGHAVLCARAAVGDAPFAVLLSDDIIRCQTEGVLQQMVSLWDAQATSVIAVEQVAESATDQYGIVSVDQTDVVGAGDYRASRLRGIIEKPPRQEAPSRLAVIGRYILEPEIFTHLADTRRGSGGEIQLTDAIASLLEERPVYAYPFVGERYDCGSKLGYVRATLDYALEDPVLAEMVRNRLAKRDGD